MAPRTLTSALAAAMLTVAASAQGAPLPARTGASVEGTEQLSGTSGFLPVAIFMLAILSIIIFADDGDDLPDSP